MPYVIIARDKPDSLAVRKANREAHLAYVAETGSVRLGGPFLDDEGNMCGSMVLLNVDSIEAAEDWARNDPYAKAELFGEVEIMAWKQTVGAE